MVGHLSLGPKPVLISRHFFGIDLECGGLEWTQKILLALWLRWGFEAFDFENSQIPTSSRRGGGGGGGGGGTNNRCRHYNGIVADEIIITRSF